MANNAVVGILRALLTIDTAQFESGTKKAKDSMRVLSRDLGQIGRQASDIGMRFTVGLTAPIVAFAVASTKAAITFESSFAGVRKTVDATEAEFAQMSQALRDLSKEIPVNVNELNRLAEAAGALGIPKEEIVDFAKVMAQLGVTTNLTSDQAAESIAKIQNIFGAAGKQTENFASTLVALGNDGAATETQIVDMATRIAGAGHTFGMTQGQVLGWANALASVGLEAEAGGTAISRTLRDMATAVSEGGKEFEAFKKIAGEDFAKAFKDDASGALLAFIEGLAKVKAEGGDLIATLKELGIVESRQIDTLLRAAGAGDVARKSLDLQNKAWSANSALTKEAQERFKTTASQLTILKNNLMDVGITIGTALKPTLDALIKGFAFLIPILEGAAQIFAALPGPIQVGIIAFAGLVAAAGPLLFIFGQLALSASALAAAFTKKGIATRLLTMLFPALTAAQVANTTATNAGTVATVASTGAMARMGVAMRGLMAAFAAAPIAVGLFTAALAGIVVPFAIVKVTELIQQLKGLMADSEGWKTGALANQAVHMRAMAEASKIAGREVKTVAEALQILNARSAELRQAGKSGGAFKLSAEQTAEARKGLFGIDTTQEAAKIKTLVQEYDALMVRVGKLTGEQKANIDAGKKLGLSMDDLVKRTGVAEDVIQAYTGSLKESKDAVKELRDELLGLADIAGAEEMAKAIKGVDIRSLTLDGQDRINKAMKDALLAYKRLGMEVPAAIRAAFNASVTSQIEISEDIRRQMVEGPDAPEEFAITPEFLDALFEADQRTSSLLTTGDALTDMLNAQADSAQEARDAIEGLAEEELTWQQHLQKTLPVIQFAIDGIAAIKNMAGQLEAAFAKSSSRASNIGNAAQIGMQQFSFLGPYGALFGFGAGAAIGAAEDPRTRVLMALNDFRVSIIKTFDEFATQQQRMEAGTDKWAQMNVLIRDTYEDIGMSAEDASRDVDKLFNSDNLNEYERNLKRINEAFERQKQLTDARRQRQEMLNEAVERYGFTFEEAGKVFQRGVLADTAETLIQDFKLLTESGADLNLIVERMAASTNEFVRQAVETGTEIPEAMRPLLAAMLDAGLLTDAAGKRVDDFASAGIKFGKELEVMFEDVLTKLDQLIEALMRPFTDFPEGRFGPPTGTRPVPRTEPLSDGPVGRGPAARHMGGIITAHKGAFLGPNEVLVKALIGESVMTPQATALLGGKAGVDALNSGRMFDGMASAIASVSGPRFSMGTAEQLRGGTISGGGNAGIRTDEGIGIQIGSIHVVSNDPRMAAEVIARELPQAISRNMHGVRTKLRKQLR